MANSGLMESPKKAAILKIPMYHVKSRIFGKFVKNELLVVHDVIYIDRAIVCAETGRFAIITAFMV